MLRKARGFRVAARMLLVGVAATVMAGLDANGAPGPAETTPRGAVDSGFVLLGGQYLPAPYVVGRRGDDLLINGRVVAKDWLARRSAPPGAAVGRGPETDPGDGQGGFSEEGDPWGEELYGPKTLGRVKEVLWAGCVLIGRGDRAVMVIEGDYAAPVLETLLSDATTEAKVESLVVQGHDRFDLPPWRTVVESFTPSAELRERIAVVAAKQRLIAEKNETRHEQLMLAGVFRSKPVGYAVTLVAMGLAVAAFGSLLSYRPDGKARWRDVDTAGDGVPMVLRNVVLLVLLGLFDLGLTLAAQQTGGLLELNPVGGQLVQSPGFLSVFKITTLLGACLILVLLRRYRGAQIASWWLCLVCTVLAFRWLTYNSMFMA